MPHKDSEHVRLEAENARYREALNEIRTWISTWDKDAESLWILNRVNKALEKEDAS